MNILSILAIMAIVAIVHCLLGVPIGDAMIVGVLLIIARFIGDIVREIRKLREKL